jgi:glutathione S-transferase
MRELNKIQCEFINFQEPHYGDIVMLTLVGFSVSNYYNKVKLALLEKNVPFEEQLNWATKDEPTLAKSPLGKVPFIVTEHGPLAESNVIMEYIESAYPAKPLMPSDPYLAAKNRELSTFMELHLELVARKLYPFAFFGRDRDEAVAESVKKELTRNIAAFAKLAKFSPYIAGDSFTAADCAAFVHLPIISMASKVVYGEDLMANLPVKAYVALIGERATAQKVNADRKTNQAEMAANRPK